MNLEEQKIRKAFIDKDWQEIKAQDTWQIFKIMAEFVEGFDKLSKIGPCVSIFGSARTKPEHAFYVKVGLGQTMSADDILQGRMIVEIGLAAVRPAEFIILRFMHKMQES